MYVIYIYIYISHTYIYIIYLRKREEQCDVLTNLSFESFLDLKLSVNTSELLFKRVNFNIHDVKLLSI